MKKYYPEGHLIYSDSNKRSLGSQLSLEEAVETGEILEAIVTVCDAGHNLVLDLGCMKGIIPREEGALGISDGKTRDIALISRVGKPVCFIVSNIKKDSDGKSYALLSRRIAQQRCLNNYILTLCPGDIIPARVTHLEGFGAFCDIGCGFVALLPIDSISISRISHTADRFRTGDDISVIVKSISDDGRTTLSFKELLGTWEENAAMFSPGETVFGTIRSVEDYGIFVELTPNLAGLAEPKEGARPGMGASVYIKSILPEKMKVKLIIIDNIDEPHIPTIPKYYFDNNHISRWVYSPSDCKKQIITEF